MAAPRPVVLVTGAGSGLGVVVAERLAADGYAVAASDIHQETAEKTLRRLSGLGHKAWRLDVTDESAIETTFRDIEASQGPIYGLVTCAGGVRNVAVAMPPTADFELDEWIFDFKLNTQGNFLCVREYLRCRRRNPLPAGRIVLISSISGQAPGKVMGVGYASSKAAILGLMRFVALEAASRGITVNTIAPGPFDSPAIRASPYMDSESEVGAVPIPVGRIGKPEEIAVGVAFLLSSEATFVTGATLDMNGGMLMR